VGYGIVGGDTPRPDELRAEVLSRISKLRDEGIALEDFEREKKRFTGAFIRGFNSLEYIAGHYTYYRFHGFDLFRGLEVLDRLDRDLLVDRVRTLLDPDGSASFVVTPK
jgi:predicted Zn-dependent peptidase